MYVVPLITTSMSRISFDGMGATLRSDSSLSGALRLRPIFLSPSYDACSTWGDPTARVD